MSEKVVVRLTPLHTIHTIQTHSVKHDENEELESSCAANKVTSNERERESMPICILTG